LKTFTAKTKPGQGFHVLPQPKYFMFMDVLCKCKKNQLFSIATLIAEMQTSGGSLKLWIGVANLYFLRQHIIVDW
jgi:hypothetical protein